MGNRLQEALRRNKERASGNFLPFYKFPSGKADIRLLPAAKGDDPDAWFIPIGLHYNVDEKRPIVCPFETDWLGDDCPVCNFVKELRAAGDNDEANDISVRRSYYARAIIRGEEDKGAQIVRLPSTLFDQIGEIVSDEEAFGDVLSPGPKGRDIRVVKSGTGLGTTYGANALPKNCSVLEDREAIKNLIAGLEPINTLITVPSFKDIEKILNDKMGLAPSGMGASVPDDDDDDEDYDAEEAITEEDEEYEEEETEEEDDDLDLDSDEDFEAEFGDDGDDDEDLPPIGTSVKAERASMKADLTKELKDKKHAVRGKTRGTK